MRKDLFVTFILLFFFVVGFSQQELEKESDRVQAFIGVELGEAVFNKFQSYSGEIGLKWSNQHLLRLVHMNVNLTEQHLSSSFAGAVDGPDVEGSFFGFEGFYDIPIFLKGLYVAPSIGYFKNEYSHTVLDEDVLNKAPTVGIGISYRESNIFKLKGLYSTISIPMRLSLNPIEETSLGVSVIKDSSFENNIWFFVGYEF